MSTPIYLITGAQGFVGAWIIKHLLSQQQSSPPQIIAHDLKHDDHILSQILTAEELASLTRVYGDISDSAVVAQLVSQYHPDHILHLAGLQIPACRANPVLGAKVNVLGTLNVFESAVKMKSSSHPVKNIIYASSAAVCGPPSDYGGESVSVPESGNHRPRTQYGVFKLTNEGNARIYWQDHRIVSVGLRPLTVFGVGREVGMTSGPTKAIKAAVLGRSYDIPFKGETSFNDVRDVARLFVLCAQTANEQTGAIVCGIKGVVSTVENFMVTTDRDTD